LPQACRLVGMVPSIVIYVVRHGESTGNRDGVLQGQSDYPLTDTGTYRYSCGVTELLCKHHRTNRVSASPILPWHTTGRQQAQLAGKRLSSTHFHAAYASDLSRWVGGWMGPVLP
jgi:broad specificity phosphatase PhoE